VSSAVRRDRPLRIAWLGGAPLETGGAPGVVTELLDGLARHGHRIDCFFPGSGNALPSRVAEHENLTFIWGTSEWRGNRWYSRTKVASFATGLFSRALASLRLRREIIRRHRQEPYDLIYQNQTIESLGVPSSVVRSVPLVIRPDSHMAGELRCLIAERQLAFRCQPRYIFFVVAAIMSFRALVQRIKIRRASLLICISSVFRDHMVHDYGFPVEKTVVITNPVRLERFAVTDRGPTDPPTVLVPTRISVRKGVEDVVSVARTLLEREADVRIRIIGGPSIWSDYTKLLEDLPGENSEYGGRTDPNGMPAELEAADVVLLASKYDPCPMSVLEALAAGVPVVATSEVGSIEGIDRFVVEEVAPGDVTAMADAILTMLEKVKADPAAMRSKARSEAERRFDRDVVATAISDALEGVVHELQSGSSAPDQPSVPVGG
jgi:glycosyltransferase involved in cell wall biosynthesis